jgi:hypothetical protein
MSSQYPTSDVCRLLFSFLCSVSFRFRFVFGLELVVIILAIRSLTPSHLCAVRLRLLVDDVDARADATSLQAQVRRGTTKREGNAWRWMVTSFIFIVCLFVICFCLLIIAFRCCNPTAHP